MAEEFESLIATICFELDLDDVLITCPHREALPFLRLMREEVTTLGMLNIRQTTIELGNHFGFRGNGVVIFDARVTTSTELRANAEKLQPRMSALQQTYRVAKEMLRSIDWHLKEFCDAVKPLNVDPFVANAPYAQRLTWVKELYSIAGQLSQWDWSTTTFVMGPLELSWTKGVMMLPYNFDGASFVRYVTDVHKAAKAKELDGMKDYEMVRSHQEEQWQQDEIRALHSNDVAGPNQVLHPATIDEFGRQSVLEEYLTTNPDGNDELKVERPMKPRTSTAPEDVEDDLTWSGMYQSPYVADTTELQSDLIRHTMMSANKKFKEEAVKRIIDDMKRASNTNSRFRRKTLGDVAGITNLKKKPVSVPGIKARGTHSIPESLKDFS